MSAGPGDPSRTALPVGFGVRLDSSVRFIRPDLLCGGSPSRFLSLNAAGRRAWEELQRGGVGSPASAVLGRRLTDVGMADPRPPALEACPDVTVVIPVLDRVDDLERCLRSLGARYPVIVVDDGSLDPVSIARVCLGHGARAERRPDNRGPAHARNQGWRLVETDLVAFLDSDCCTDAAWIQALAAHLADPAVAAVAPRVTAVHAGLRPSGRYAAVRSPLDLGTQAAPVAPLTRVSYVPTAALLVRRRALEDVGGFDESLRCGEDVDLVWRLVEAGWRVRYEPSVVVGHREPPRWSGRIGRRFRYGASAAPLARRHPGSVPPLILAPWPVLCVLALLGRRPVLALASATFATGWLGRRLRGLRVPWSQPVVVVGTAVKQTWLGMGRCGIQFLLPALLGLLVHPGGRHRRTRLGRRLAVASLLVGPPGAEWWRRRSAIGAVPFVAAYLLDEAAYGAGVCHGCLRARSWAPLLPQFRWRTGGPPASGTPLSTRRSR